MQLKSVKYENVINPNDNILCHHIFIECAVVLWPEVQFNRSSFVSRCVLNSIVAMNLH